MVEPTEAAAVMIERLKEKVSKVEAELLTRKRLVNALAAEEGLPAVYSIADGDCTGGAPASGYFIIKADQFHAMPLATAVRNVLDMRHKAGALEKTATAEEIYADLIRGGYEFETKDRDKAIHSLKVSLGKNPVFRSVGQTGRYGLSEWYGGPKKRDTKQADAISPAADDQVAESVKTEKAANGDAE